MAASSSPSSEDPFEIGSVLDGRYRIDALLGTGGMGRVYRAEHTKIGKSVAIKVLHADLGRNREASQRFQREAIASGRLDHPNIVGVSDFGVLDDGACYLVMEVLEGESLGDRLARDGHIHWAEAIQILRGVLHGLRHAHERGVVHRDIKPDNVYLAYKDGEPVIKILDFGIAKLYAGTDEDPASTRAGLTVGTPAYLSPEQAVGGEITPKSDLYSASIVLYEMLAGRAPFEDKDPLAMLGAHVSRRPPPFAEVAPGVDVPPPLEDIMQRGLMKMAAERIASAGDYLAMLDGFSPPSHASGRFATSPGLPLPTPEALGTMATASPLSSLVIDRASGPVPTGSGPVHAATPVPGTASALPVAAVSSTGGSPVVPALTTGASPVVMTTGGSPVVPALTTGASPVVMTTGASPVVPVLTTGASPVVPGADKARLPRSTRAVSLADVVEPIPKTWIVRSGVFVGIMVVAAMALAVVTRCSGSSSTPAPVTRTAPVQGSASARLPTPAPPRAAPAAPKSPAMTTRPPAPAVPAKPEPAPAPAAVAAPVTPAPGATPTVKPDARDPQLKALLRTLETGRTCPIRKSAIAKLVALRHPGAIPPLKQARYRMSNGVLGLGRRNYNACLTADAERAIKALSSAAR